MTEKQKVPKYFLHEVPNTDDGRAFLSKLRAFRNPAYRIRVRGSGRNEAAKEAGLKFAQSTPLEHAAHVRVYIEPNTEFYEADWPGRSEGWHDGYKAGTNKVKVEFDADIAEEINRQAKRNYEKGYEAGKNADEKFSSDSMDAACQDAYKKGQDDLRKRMSETRPFNIGDLNDKFNQGVATGRAAMMDEMKSAFTTIMEIFK
jgi:hypothetical protein